MRISDALNATICNAHCTLVLTWTNVTDTWRNICAFHKFTETAELHLIALCKCHLKLHGTAKFVIHKGKIFNRAKSSWIDCCSSCSKHHFKAVQHYAVYVCGVTAGCWYGYWRTAAVLYGSCFASFRRSGWRRTRDREFATGKKRTPIRTGQYVSMSYCSLFRLHFQHFYLKYVSKMM